MITMNPIILKPKGRPGTKIDTAIKKLIAKQTRRIPEYTIEAASLRKPALASLFFRLFCSSSLCGISGFEIDFTASASPWNLFPLPALAGSSMSANDCGLLKRDNRSSAWLLRLEIMDKNAQITATIPANTSKGIMSSKPRTANNMGLTSRGKSQELPAVDDEF